MNKRLIIIASVFGILAVILGAFGAHALKSLLDPAGLEVWKTAVSYHFYHTLALLFLQAIAEPETWLAGSSLLGFCFFRVLYILFLQRKY